MEIYRKVRTMSEEKFKTIVEHLEKLTVLELSELVKVLEEKFGVSAAAPAMIMAGSGRRGRGSGRRKDRIYGGTDRNWRQ